MAYKTILVHFDSEPRVKTLSAYAMALAEQHEAHLIGLAVLPSFADVPPAETGTRALIDDLRDAYRADAARMQAVFETRGPIQTISTEWRLADPGFRQTADAVAEQGQAADLIVASQDNPDWRADGFRDAAGLLAIEASRPVLLVPHQGYPAGPAKRVVVAWDGSREATRATFDALPCRKAPTRSRSSQFSPGRNAKVLSLRSGNSRAKTFAMPCRAKVSIARSIWKRRGKTASVRRCWAQLNGTPLICWSWAVTAIRVFARWSSAA